MAKKVGRINITPKDLKEIELTYFSDNIIAEAATQVFTEYITLGGNGKVAKGSELIEKIKALISF